MAIEAFGLATSTTGAVQQSIRITASSAPSALYLRWHTLEATGTIKAFDIAISCRRVKRGGRGVSEPGYGDWSDWYYEQVAIADCHPTADTTGYSYYHTLDINGLYKGEGLSGGFAFASRVNDQMDFQLKIKAIYEDAWATAYNAGVNYSPVTYANAYIGYIPTYTVSSASFDGTGNLKIVFSRPDWTRTDDSICITSYKSFAKEYVVNKQTLYPIGDGTITLPRENVSRAFKAGIAYISFTVYASYKPQQYALASVASAKVKIVDLSVSSTPTVSLNVRNKTQIIVSIGDTGDQSITSTRYNIHMVGYDDVVDNRFVTSHSAIFYFAPFDTDLTFQVQGFSSDGTAQSAIVEQTINMPAPAPIVINSISTDGKYTYGTPSGFNLRYDATSKRQVDRDVNVVKLAGRSRSSVYFGTGAEVTDTLTGKLIDQAGIELNVPDTVETFVTESTIIMLRKSGGYRHRGVLTKASTTRGPVSPVIDVQLTFEEVDD